MMMMRSGNVSRCSKSRKESVEWLARFEVGRKCGRNFGLCFVFKERKVEERRAVVSFYLVFHEDLVGLIDFGQFLLKPDFATSEE